LKLLRSASRAAKSGNMLQNNDLSQQDPTFWLNRRVLVTGHTGFLGSWIASRLSVLGAELTGFARRPATPLSLFTLAGLAGRVENVTGDIRDRARVEQTVASLAPEIIVHLAGRRHVAASLKRPLDSFDTNATGTLNLLHAARSNPELRAILILMPDLAGRSSGAAAPRDPLAASVACAEIIVESFRQCYLQPADGVGLAVLRLPELVGGGDFAAGRLVPGLVRAAAAGRVPSVDASSGTQPLLHVLDALAGCDLLARALVRRPGTYARSWTAPAAPPAPWTRARIAAHVAAGLGGRPAPATSAGSDGAPGSAPATPVPEASPVSLAAALGWHPELDVAAALDWALAGYRRFETEADGGFITDQIERHQALSTRRRPSNPAVPQQPQPATKASHVHLPA
jgi:CDP-glucose 4,6-dehydratase